MALVTVSVPDELAARLERLTRARDVSESAFVERAIVEKLERDAEQTLRDLGALRTRAGDPDRGPLPADGLTAAG
jgi:predicted transcriptional regulator